MELFQPLHLQSEQMVLRILQELHPCASRANLYDSAAKVAACARQANAFDISAATSDISVQPLLRYYGILHWIKTVLTLYDLNYPPSTSVLQHGISVRRLKRSEYRWPLEAIYVYKEGVFQSFKDLVSPHVVLPQRLVLGELLGSLPRMVDCIQGLYPQFQHAYPVISDGEKETVARRIASNIGMTTDEWKARFIEVAGTHTAPASERGSLSEEPGLLELPGSSEGHPWSCWANGKVYLRHEESLPEWMVHFVILFSLSSLCRYNPVEWSEMMHWNNETDAFIVREYLKQYGVEEIKGLMMVSPSSAPALK